MGHHCCSKQKVKRGLWSPEEDEKLVNYITNHGHGSWSSVPKQAGLQRCGKSCRLRWINYLRPDLKRGSFTEEEERTIIEVHRILGNRWAQIAKHLPGRTDNEVKNFWNSCIKKKLLAQGLDPNTHNLLPSNQKNSKKNNPPNSTKSTIPYHRMPSNSTSLVFSIDNPSPENIIREAIQSCFPSSNNGIQNNIYPNHSEIQDLSSQNIALSNSSKVSNLVMSDVNNCAYMVDESYSMWNDAILENLEQPLARAEVVMQPQQVSLCDDGVDHDYGIIKNLQVNQNLDDTSTFNSPCFDVGFGDYSSIIMSGSLYGEMGLAMDQVAWGNC